MASWLADNSDTSSCFVVGDAGAGKSALLGVLASAAGAGRSSLPAALQRSLAGVNDFYFDFLLFERGISARALLEAIARQARVNPAALPRELDQAAEVVAKEIGKLRRRLTVLIDGVDEIEVETPPGSAAAIGQRDDLALLLDPLLASSKIRMLLGGRSNMLTSLNIKKNDRRVVDLDGEYWEVEDLEARVRAVLEGDQALEKPASPWAAEEHVADLGTAVGKIVEVAGKSFLFGETVARTQAARVPDALDQAWIDSLPQEVYGAIKAELRDRLGPNLERTLDLLRPLAYAGGIGMPLSEVWEPLTTKLERSSADPISSEDLRRLTRDASTYVIPEQTKDGTVWTLYHARLQDLLLADRNHAQDQAIITDVLVKDVGRIESGPVDGRPADAPAGGFPRNWAKALHYTRAHLLDHARAGHSPHLDELVGDPGFLAHGDPTTLRSALGQLTEPGHRLVAEAYTAATQALPIRSAPNDPADTGDSENVREFLAQLSLAARCAGANQLAARVALGPGAGEAPWRVDWAAWRRQPPHLRLTGHDGAVQASVIGRLGADGYVAVTADATGRIWAWRRLPDRVERWHHAHPDGRGVTALAIAVQDGTPILLYADGDGVVRALTLKDGKPWGGQAKPQRKRPGTTALVCLKWGTALRAFTGGADGALQPWSVGDRARPRGGHRDTGVRISCLASAELGGRACVFSGHEDGQIRRWCRDDPPGSDGAFTAVGKAGVLALTTGSLDGATVLVAGDLDGRIHVLDAETGRPKWQPRGEAHSSEVTALVVTEPEPGRPVIISGANDGTVRVWSLADGNQIGGDFTAHGSFGIRTLSAVRVGERAVVVSGSQDGSCRVWDLMPGGPVSDSFDGHRDAVRALHFVSSGPRKLVVSGGADATVRRWDPDTGAQIGGALRDERARRLVTAVTSAEIDGAQRLITGRGDGQVVAWSADSGEAFGPTLPRNGSWVTALATVEIAGTPEVVVATHRGGKPPDIGRVRVWNPKTGVPRDEHRYGGHDKAARVTALCTVMVGTSPRIVSADVDALLHIWDPATGGLVELRPSEVGEVRALATVMKIEADGSQDATTQVVVAGDDGFALHDLDDLDPGSAAELITTDGGASCTAVVAVWHGGKRVLVTGHDDGTIRFRTLDEPTRTATFQPHRDGIHSLALGVVRGRPAVFSDAKDNRIRAWDVEHSAPLADPHRGRVRAVAVGPPAVAVGSSEKEAWVASGGDDDMVQVRMLRDGRAVGRPTRARTGGVRTLAAAVVDGRPTIVAGGTEPFIVVMRDPRIGGRGDPVLQRTEWRSTGVRAVALTERDGRPIAVAAADGEDVTPWSLGSRLAAGTPLLRDNQIRALATARLPIDGLPLEVVVAGSASRHLYVVDVQTGTSISRWQTDRPIRAIAAAEIGGEAIVITADDQAVVAWWIPGDGDEPPTPSETGAVPHGPGEVRALAVRDTGSRTWAAVAAGTTVTLSVAEDDGMLWEEQAVVDLGVDVLSVAIAEFDHLDRPGQLVVGATHGVLALQVAQTD